MSQLGKEYYKTTATLICNFIDSRYQTQIHFRDLLQYLQTSLPIHEKKCRSIIHDFMLTSFPELVNTVRLFKTIELYKNDFKPSIFHAAIDSGFIDRQHFIKWWKRCTTIDPPKYREHLPSHTQIMTKESRELLTIFLQYKSAKK